MELILELLYESRKSYIEWKQIICAVFLALLFSGMYYYMSVQAGFCEKWMMYSSWIA